MRSDIPADHEDQSEETYIFFLDDFTIPLIDASVQYSEQFTIEFNLDQLEADGRSEKKYTFMLILPQHLIGDKLDAVSSIIHEKINGPYVFPFICIILAMIVIISWLLKIISYGILAPIIELNQNI